MRHGHTSGRSTASTAGSAIPHSTLRYTGGSVADAGYLPATTTADPGYAVLRVTEDPHPLATSTAPVATIPTRSRSRERRSRPAQRRTRRTSSGRSPDDPDSPADPEPPPLPVRIAGPAGDDSAVQAAFLAILTRRHPGTRWQVTT